MFSMDRIYSKLRYSHVRAILLRPWTSVGCNSLFLASNQDENDAGYKRNLHRLVGTA